MIYRPEYDMKSIGENLRKLREARHLTVEEVREYLCLGSVQAVYKYEKGKSYPQADTMFALMELYGATLFDIIGGPHLVHEKVEAGLVGPASVFILNIILGFILNIILGFILNIILSFILNIMLDFILNIIGLFIEL